MDGLKEMLRSLLREEIQDIRTDIKDLKRSQEETRVDLKELKAGQDRMELKLDNLATEMRSGMNQLERTIKEHRVVIDLLQSGEKQETPKIRHKF